LKIWDKYLSFIKWYSSPNDSGDDS
jgi:hypothetical protein